MHVYEVRSRKDKRGIDLISDALPFGGLWYTKPDDAVSYAKFFSRSHDAMIRVYDDAYSPHERSGIRFCDLLGRMEGLLIYERGNSTRRGIDRRSDVPQQLMGGAYAVRICHT